MGGGGLWVVVWAEAGFLARRAGSASAGAAVETEFVEATAAGGGGRALGAGGRGTTGLLWAGFAVGRGTLTGAGREVGGPGFCVGGAVLVSGDRAAFWVG